MREALDGSFEIGSAGVEGTADEADGWGAVDCAATGLIDAETATNVDSPADTVVRRKEILIQGCW